MKGDKLGIAEQWRLGPVLEQPEDPSELGPLVAQLMADAALNPDMGGRPRGGAGRPNHEI